MRKVFFTIFITGVFFANCQNRAVQNKSPENKSGQPKMVYAGWEEGDILQNVFSPYSLCTPYAGTITDSIARKGKKAVRFELRVTDTICGSSKRAELYINSKMAARENFTWYAWSEYLPADYAFDKINEIHFQLHTNTVQGPPVIGFWISEDHWSLVQTFDTIDVANKKHSIQAHNLGPVIKGKWNDWVLHVNFSCGDDGFIQMWRNDSLVLDIKGPNFSRENGRPIESPYMKFGIYKWRWKDYTGGPISPDTRVAYFDEVRVAQEGATLDDFIIKDEENKARAKENDKDKTNRGKSRNKKKQP